MNSQNIVGQIREQRTEKHGDIGDIKIVWARERESREAERIGLLKRGMKWYCSLLLLGVLCLCEAMPDHWAQLCAAASATVCMWKRLQKRKSILKWWCQIFEERIIALCVTMCQRTALIITAQGLKGRTQAKPKAKPCRTSLNQAQTNSTQHALCFKPWLIGPKASNSPIPAVTVTGLGKEMSMERNKNNKVEKAAGRLVFFFIHPFPWTPNGSIPFCSLESLPIQYAQAYFYWLSWLRTQMLSLNWLLTELKVMSRDYEQAGNLAN